VLARGRKADCIGGLRDLVEVTSVLRRGEVDRGGRVESLTAPGRLRQTDPRDIMSSGRRIRWAWKLPRQFWLRNKVT
jgi:hypothetical protein